MTEPGQPRERDGVLKVQKRMLVELSGMGPKVDLAALSLSDFAWKPMLLPPSGQGCLSGDLQMMMWLSLRLRVLHWQNELSQVKR